MRSLILPPKCINFPKRFIKQREIRFSLQDSKRPKGLRLFDFFPNNKMKHFSDFWKTLFYYLIKYVCRIIIFLFLVCYFEKEYKHTTVAMLGLFFYQFPNRIIFFLQYAFLWILIPFIYSMAVKHTHSHTIH